MPCCGEKRRAFHQSTPLPPAHTPPSANSPRRSFTEVLVPFEYGGKTGMTAIGPITGRRYRFNQPGAVVPVDSRDAPSLLAVPHLRRARTAGG
jgi:hypothetical protein